MERLLQFEFRKWRQRKSLYICFCVLVAYLILSMLFVRTLIIAEETTLRAEGIASADFGEFITYPTAVEYVFSTGSSILTTLLCIFASLSIGEDYSNATFKTICTRGYTRWQIYASKWAVIMATAILYIAASMLTNLVVGAILFPFGTPDAEMVSGFFVNVLGTLAYTTLYIAIATAVRSAAGSIAIGILAPPIFRTFLSLEELVWPRYVNFRFSYYTISSLTALWGWNDSMALIDQVFFSSAFLLVYAAIFTLIGALFARRQEV